MHDANSNRNNNPPVHGRPKRPTPEQVFGRDRGLVDRLCQGMSDPDPKERRSAAIRLATSAQKGVDITAAMPALEKAFSDPDETVRIASFVAMRVVAQDRGCPGSLKALSALIGACLDSGRNVRELAAETIDMLAKTGAQVPELVALYADKIITQKTARDALAIHAGRMEASAGFGKLLSDEPGDKAHTEAELLAAVKAADKSDKRVISAFLQLAGEPTINGTVAPSNYPSVQEAARKALPQTN